jgi:molybdate transport system permease protein
MDWIAFSLSLKLAAVTCAIVLPIGLVLARLLAWAEFPGKAVIETLIMLPLVLPPTVLGYYLLVGFSPLSQPGAFVSDVLGAPLIFTFEGLVVASLIANLPFAVAPMQRAFEAIPRNVREAAWVSGLSSVATLRRIELPLAWPGLVTALGLVFAHTLGEFGVILMVGGNIPGETQTLSIAIYDRMQAMREGEAGIMAATLLGFSFLAMALIHYLARRRATLNG